MDSKKIIFLFLFYFALISILFFGVKYFVLKETLDIKNLAIESVISGFIGALILSYMIRRWTNNSNKL